MEPGSHAEGTATTAKSRYSHAEGYKTIAGSDYSASTISINVAQHAEGY